MESHRTTRQTEEINLNEVEKEAKNNLPKESQVFGRSEYAKKDFWNDRFKNSKGFFDWYLEYNELKPYFDKVYPIKKDHSILMVGCGNSKELSEEMYTDGYQNITNIDISDTVIENMKKHYEENNIKIECLEMDATEMKFEDCSFDVVIDKGTLDALLCGKDIEIVKKLIKEMTRVLKITGELFIISHGNPTSRRELFRQAVNIENFEFLYAEQKLSDVAQLINIFRSKLKNKPLSQILKEKELLKESLLEFTSLKKKSIAKRIIEMKKHMDSQKEGKIKPQENLQGNDKKNIEQINRKNEEHIENAFKEVDQDKRIDKDLNTNIKQYSEAFDKKTEKETYEEEKINKSKEELDYNPQRQAHCYIYYAKKLR